MSIRSKALEVAFRYIGDPYEWAGDGPGGIGGDDFDCSGFIQHILVETGVYPPSIDFTAQNIYNAYKKFAITVPIRGGIAFYGKKSNSIKHCVLIINRRAIIGAHGGGIQKITVEKIDYRNDIIAMVDPFKNISKEVL